MRPSIGQKSPTLRSGRSQSPTQSFCTIIYRIQAQELLQSTSLQKRDGNKNDFMTFMSGAVPFMSSRRPLQTAENSLDGSLAPYVPSIWDFHPGTPAQFLSFSIRPQATSRPNFTWFLTTGLLQSLRQPLHSPISTPLSGPNCLVTLRINMLVTMTQPSIHPQTTTNSILPCMNSTPIASLQSPPPWTRPLHPLNFRFLHLPPLQSSQRTLH